MNDPPNAPRQRARHGLEHEVQEKELRKLRARANPQSVWFGLGMFGLVGWSVAVPALVGIGLGVWIDRRWPSRFSWTLMLLFLGIAFGCLNAWRWVSRESRFGGEER